MCEPPPDGARGPSSATGASPHEPHEPHEPPSRDRGLSFPSSAATHTTICVTSPLELRTPPSSPPLLQHCHPIDIIIKQLENQSLIQSTTQPPPRIPTALSPTSKPGDSVLDHLSSTEALVADTQMIDAWEPSRPQPSSRTRARERARETRSESILAMISSETQCRIHPPPGPLTPMIPDPSQDEEQFVVHPNIHFAEALPDIDEGYCEDDLNLSWLGTNEPNPSSGMKNNRLGVSKNFRLRFRSSSEAANNCPNLVRNVVRMRRREGHKRRKKSTPQSSSSSSTPTPSGQ